MYYYGNKMYIFILFNVDFFIIKKGLLDFFFYVRGWEVVFLIFYIKCFI